MVEYTMLVLSLLFFASIFTDKIGFKYGVPALIFFLAVGILWGREGLPTIIWPEDNYDDFNIDGVQAIGTIALTIILFTGGMDTKTKDILPIAGPGVCLATIGVLITCAITGVAIHYVSTWIPFIPTMEIGMALLIAATMSSTDSASVFSILRTNNVKLKHNLRPLLELESGANDPMAYILTVTLIGIVTSSSTEVNTLSIVQDILIQLVMGGVMGFAFGKVIVYLLKHARLNNESLYPIMVLTACIFIFAATYFLKGNPYLAVYIGGLIIGNSRFTKRRQTKSFFDGLTWLSQLFMFLILGMCVKPSDFLLMEVWLPCLIISIIMICFSRPIAVWFSLFPWRKQFTQNDKIFTSWVGLKGAVPIIFAIMCEAAKVPSSDRIFDIVFMCTLVSLLVQGTSLNKIASTLKLSYPARNKKKLEYFDFELPEEVEARAWEREVNEELLHSGTCLKNITVPDHTLVIMARRGETFFVPTGDTELQIGDILLVISDNNMEQTTQEIENEDSEILTHWWLNMTRNTKSFVKTKLNKLKNQQ